MLRVKRWLFLGWGAAACFLYVNSTWGPFLYNFHLLCGDFGPHTKKIKVYGNCKKRTSCGILHTERKQQHPNPKTFKVWPSACSLHTFPHYAYLKKPDLTNSKMNLLCVRIFWKLVLPPPPPPLLLLHDCDGTRTTTDIAWPAAHSSAFSLRTLTSINRKAAMHFPHLERKTLIYHVSRASWSFYCADMRRTLFRVFTDFI